MTIKRSREEQDQDTDEQNCARRAKLCVERNEQVLIEYVKVLNHNKQQPAPTPSGEETRKYSRWQDTRKSTRSPEMI